jgi:hypothetical protein
VRAQTENPLYSQALSQASTNLIIKRRGFKLSRKSIEDFREKNLKSKVPSLGQASALKVQGYEFSFCAPIWIICNTLERSPMRLLLIRFTCPELLTRFLNMLVLPSLVSSLQPHSASHSDPQAIITAAAAAEGSAARVALLPRAWVRRATAAAAINATARSFISRCRHSKMRNLCDLRLRSRSIVVLQRWWRWSVCMRHRLHFLSHLRSSLQALGGGKILMSERATLEELDLDRAEYSRWRLRIEKL